MSSDLRERGKRTALTFSLGKNLPFNDEGVDQSRKGQRTRISWRWRETTTGDGTWWAKVIC